MPDKSNQTRRSQNYFLYKLRSSPQIARELLSSLRSAIRERFHLQSKSIDYKKWQDQFLIRRLRLAFLIIFPCISTFAFTGIYEVFSPGFGGNLGAAYIQLRQNLTLWSYFSIFISLVICAAVNSTWLGKKYPIIVFLSTSWAMTIPPQIVGNIFKSYFYPIEDWILIFFGQAILIPVRWRLHLVSQVIAVASSLGLPIIMAYLSVKNRNYINLSYIITSNSYVLVRVFWTCFICCFAVYIYERLKQSELASQQQLHVFLHSVSHDLKTPVMGASVVLQNLLEQPDTKIVVDRMILQRLLHGSDRQLKLINTLLEARTRNSNAISLCFEPIEIRTFVETVLSEFLPKLKNNQINLDHHTSLDLPLIYADKIQLWRVYSNLIENSIQHNPHCIQITLDAQVTKTISKKTGRSLNQVLRCTIQDNGIGIPLAQQPELFELYTRGKCARYTPGLGLGLYSSKQIITAHGGEIGVISQPGKGSTFWFTLPLHQA